jgi:transposase
MPNAIKKRRRQSDGNSKSDQVRALLAKGMSAGDIAKKVGCSTNLVYVVKSTGGGGVWPRADSKSAQVRALLATGMDAAAIAKKVGCSTNLVYVVKSTTGANGKRATNRRAPSRQRIGSKNLNGIDGILAVVQGAERERAQLRAALEKIQAVLADALA